MNGPKHYAAAERLVVNAEDHIRTTGNQLGIRETIALAQVHATLALAAATALRTASGAVPDPDWIAWNHVAGHLSGCDLTE